MQQLAYFNSRCYQTVDGTRQFRNAYVIISSIFSLSFFTVLNGYSSVAIALSKDLDIRLNTAVKKIRYWDGGVEITAENLKTNNSQVIHKGENLLFMLNDYS